MHPIGEAAALSGVHVETIRYYEREGIVPRVPRSPSGRRQYAAEDVARLRFVKRCRDLWFPIPDIRALLDLAADGTAPCPEVKAVGERHLRGIERKIEDLAKLEHAVRDLVKRCGAGRDECEMLDQLFADSSGSGSR